MHRPSEVDRLWYQDAIIYEIHVRAFADSNADGIGDFPGLTEKLDYLVDLGVTALWLLPFYPSPLKDGGYDIADYTQINPSYGTKKDFQRFLDEAHRRGLKVITELVLNHTSADHPWFQRARKAPPGSPHRDFYVWSDAPRRYEDARIIFRDFESSNWSWDPVAQAYYWHRFYSHQPDLNFDNPAVHEALLAAVDHWFELGVDGLRLDAVPYLYERDGTNCENLPETHAFLKKLRAHVDAKFEGRMLLAEANMWPSDAAAYFGEGDECHMNFHFPLMPRMFMAVELEDSFPLINILRQTPALPPGCQWATFLRNHDELTLEMVTDEDRETMWRLYALERTARINLGIRRRLAPLMGVRTKVELMNALLLSLPGTPVLYYGDEIGMGDNIYLGDRDGVRTPMQWSADRNGGFSRANPQKLYLPTIIDPEYHYEAINVELQQSNTSSLLWWMKRLLAVRKKHDVFGRGAIEFLRPDNGKILAFYREHEGHVVLVVANLSRHAQSVELDLARHEGRVPVELFGRTRFPAVTQSPYHFSLSPHGFYWFALETPRPVDADDVRTIQRLVCQEAWTAQLAPRARPQLAELLAEYVAKRRWYRAKARNMKQASITDVTPWRHEGEDFATVFLTLEYDEGRPETYVVPLGFVAEPASRDIPRPGGVIADLVVRRAGDPDVEGVLFDAMLSPGFACALLRTMQGSASLRGEAGEILGHAFASLLEGAPGAELTPRPGSAEQTNSSIQFGSRFFLKLYRVAEHGPNPELEIGKYFLAHPAHTATARLAGALEYAVPGAEPATLATLHEAVPNQGDAWALTLDSLGRFYERVLSEEQLPAEPPRMPGTRLERASRAPTVAQGQWIGAYIERVRLLGVRTAEMHLALATSGEDDPAFTRQPFDLMHQQSLFQSAHNLLVRTFELLRKRLPRLPEHVRPLVEAALAREDDVTTRLRRVTSRKIEVDKIRVHGDFHLGQVLWTDDDFVIIDFEGEPARPLTQRRFKRCPLLDVAAMIRSFSYAGAAALRRGNVRAEDVPKLEPWSRAWEDWIASAYLGGYVERSRGAELVPQDPEGAGILIDHYLFEKCIYEIGYELQSRPDWLDIPLRGLLALLEE